MSDLSNYKFSHLSEEQINEIINKYYDGSNLNSLILDYKIDTTENEFYDILPLEYHWDIKCKTCKIPMVSKKLKRSASDFDIKIYCPNCNNLYSGDYKNYKYIETAQRIITLQKKIVDKLHLEINNSNTVSVNNISMKDALFFISFIRNNSSEDLNVISTLYQQNNKFYPGIYISGNIFASLRLCGLIEVSKKVL